MKFAEPLWLFGGLVFIASLFWLYRRFDLRQRAALADFASSHLLDRLTASFSPGRRRLKRVLFATAVAFIFVALARPQWGYHWEEQKSRGIDILFAIDTSKSMLTQDVNPSRLTRAKLAITDLVRKLDGDRVGLIAFAGDAFLQAPLTIDYDAFQETLDAVDVGVVPRGGTDISSAIQEAQAAFSAGSKNRKILVLVTDGEDLEGQGIDAARAADKDGMTIYTVGVGTAAGGLIPIPNDNGGTDFLKDESGQYVKSHLDENTLKQIAEATGGIYEPLGQQGQGLADLYRKALESLPKQELASRARRVYEERFQWPLGAGLLFLLASTMIGTRKREVRSSYRTQKARPTAAIIGVLALMASLSVAHASPQSAEQAYKKGDFTDAEKQYEQATEQRPQVAPLQFDLGAAAYKSNDYDKALPAFQGALKTDQVGVQQRAYYNIGNTQYRLGQKTEQSSPEDTIKTWQAAVQSYDAALHLDAQDGDARFNRDFVEKKLEQLQKQQKQNQDQNQKQNQQNQQDKISSNRSKIRMISPIRGNKISSNSRDNPDNSKIKGNQANNQKQSSDSQKSQQSEAQNGKSDQQNQANGNSQQNQNGQQTQQQNQSGGQQQTAQNQQNGNKDAQNSSLAQKMAEKASRAAR